MKLLIHFHSNGCTVEVWKFHSTLNDGCSYLSILDFKLTHVTLGPPVNIGPVLCGVISIGKHFSYRLYDMYTIPMMTMAAIRIKERVPPTAAPVKNNWRQYGPLTRYAKLCVAHAPGMPWTFFRLYRLISTLLQTWFNFNLSLDKLSRAQLVWNEITYPFINFNVTIGEVLEWISNLIPHFIIVPSMLGSKLNHV